MLKPVTVLRLASAAVLSLPLLAQAAGLGRMCVQSFLGQPLRAEIEIVSVQLTPDAAAYAYSYHRILSDLLLVNGLR